MKRIIIILIVLTLLLLSGCNQPQEYKVTLKDVNFYDKNITIGEFEFICNGLYPSKCNKDLINLLEK